MTDSIYAKAFSESPPRRPRRASARSSSIPSWSSSSASTKLLRIGPSRTTFVFAGRIREKPRERNSVRTRILYGATEKANAELAAEDRPPLPDGITFHALRRTYAALRAELGEHPAITAAQMGHRDPRMTLRVYTDVIGVKPRTRLGGLLGNAEWAQPLTNEISTVRGRKAR